MIKHRGFESALPSLLPMLWPLPAHLHHHDLSDHPAVFPGMIDAKHQQLVLVYA